MIILESLSGSRIRSRKPKASAWCLVSRHPAVIALNSKPQTLIRPQTLNKYSNGWPVLPSEGLRQRASQRCAMSAGLSLPGTSIGWGARFRVYWAAVKELKNRGIQSTTGFPHYNSLNILNNNPVLFQTFFSGIEMWLKEMGAIQGTSLGRIQGLGFRA